MVDWTSQLLHFLTYYISSVLFEGVKYSVLLLSYVFNLVFNQEEEKFDPSRRRQAFAWENDANGGVNNCLRA